MADYPNISVYAGCQNVRRCLTSEFDNPCTNHLGFTNAPEAVTSSSYLMQPKDVWPAPVRSLTGPNKELSTFSKALKPPTNDTNPARAAPELVTKELRQVKDVLTIPARIPFASAALQCTPPTRRRDPSTARKAGRWPGRASPVLLHLSGEGPRQGDCTPGKPNGCFEMAPRSSMCQVIGLVP